MATRLDDAETVLLLALEVGDVTSAEAKALTREAERIARERRAEARARLRRTGEHTRMTRDEIADRLDADRQARKCRDAAKALMAVAQAHGTKR